MRNVFKTALAVGGAVLALAGATAWAGTGTTRSSAGDEIPLVRMGTYFTFSNLNLENTDNYSSAAWLESLVAIDKSGRVVPWLAQSVDNPSPTVYIYHLRHGVKFWDGNEMTSADVVASMNHYRNPKALTSGLYYQSVSKVAAVDPYTVRVTLKHPDPSWPASAAQGSGVFEKKFADAHPTTMGNPGVLLQATGPLKLDSFDPTKGIELSANPNWWGGAVKVQHMEIKLFQNETSLALAVRAGDIDVAFPQTARGFERTSGAKVISAPSDTSAGIALNTRVAPWSDVHVRRAVAYAIDKSAEIKVSEDPSVPVDTLFTPAQLARLGSSEQLAAVLRGVPKYPYNLAKARAELAKSAYPKGFSGTTDTLDFGVYTPVTEVFVDQLKKIGINLKIRKLTLAKWIAEWNGPKTFGSLVITNLTVYGPDPNINAPLILSSAATSGGVNDGNYKNPEVDALMRQAAAEQVPSKRLAIYGKVLKILGTDLPYVMLYNHASDLALSDKFSWPTFHQYFYTKPWVLQLVAK